MKIKAFKVKIHALRIPWERFISIWKFSWGWIKERHDDCIFHQCPFIVWAELSQLWDSEAVYLQTPVKDMDNNQIWRIPLLHKFDVWSLLPHKLWHSLKLRHLENWPYFRKLGLDHTVKQRHFMEFSVIYRNTIKLKNDKKKMTRMI